MALKNEATKRPHCGNCRWWMPPEELDPPRMNGYGDCHGGPPTALIQTERNKITNAIEQSLVSAWPPTGRGDLCGLYEKAKES